MAKKSKPGKIKQKRKSDLGGFGQTFRFDSQGNLLKQKWQKPVMVL